MLPSRVDDSHLYTPQERARFLQAISYRPTPASEHAFAEIRDAFEKTPPRGGGSTTKNGKFVLGKGNFGKVCLGVQTAHERVVAVKTEYRHKASSNATAPEVEFLRRVADLAVERRNTNQRVPQVIEMFDVAQTFHMSKQAKPVRKRHIVMECGGPSLAADLKAPDSDLSEERIAHIIRDIGNGINDLLAVNVAPPSDLGITNIVGTARGATIIDLGLAQDLASACPAKIDEARSQAFRNLVRLARCLFQLLETRLEEPISDAAATLIGGTSANHRGAIDSFLANHGLALDGL